MTTTTMKKLSLALASIALAGCAIQKPAPLGPQPTAQLGPQLSADQIRGAVVGNTGTGPRTSTNAIYTMYIAPDGTLASRIAGRADTGTWRITDDGLFCVTWRHDYNGRELCQDAHKTGTAVALHSPISLQELTFEPGNRL